MRKVNAYLDDNAGRQPPTSALARVVGLQGKQKLVRAYGLREVVAGVQTPSMDKPVGLASRIVGDMPDVATLMTALSSSNPRRGNAALALGAVATITVLDCMAYAATAATAARFAATATAVACHAVSRRRGAWRVPRPPEATA